MLRRWLIMGFAATGLSLALAGGYTWAARPETYHDGVIEALDQRRVTYSGLEVREVCLPDPRCLVSDGARTYAAVLVHGGAASYGLITCYDRRGDCYLDVATLDIHRMPLRDPRGVRFAPRQVVREIARIAGWLRAVAKHGRSSFVSGLPSG